MKFYENKDVSIICPNCKKFLIKADSRDSRIHQKACKNCGKWIWYKANDPEYREIKEVPKRETISGVVFY